MLDVLDVYIPGTLGLDQWRSTESESGMAIQGPGDAGSNRWLCLKMGDTQEIGKKMQKWWYHFKFADILGSDCCLKMECDSIM